MISNHSIKNSFFLKFLLVKIVILLIVGFAGISYIITREKQLSDRIYPNVFIDNIPVGSYSKSQAVALFEGKNERLDKLTVSVLYKESPIATYSAADLSVRSNIDEIVDRAFLIGRVSHTPSRVYQKFITLFNLAQFTFDTRISYDTSVINEFILNSELQYNKPAKNALFKFENGRVTTFRSEENGLALKSDAFIQDFDSQIASLKKTEKNLTVKLEDEVIVPEVTLAQSNDFGIEEVIGVGTSDYSHSIPEREHNVILATAKFNGVLIEPGKELSFGATIGDISSATGYKPAYIISGGRTILGDGGGVCQVSTTLFRAALNTGLPITERHAHAYRVGYYENDAPAGLDATVFYPSVDLKIKNDTPAHILVETSVDEANKKVTFRLYGKKDGRRAETTTPVLTNISAPPPAVNQEDPTLPRGVTKQVDFPAWGGKSTFTYKIIRADNTVEEKVFASNYRPWAAVYLVGTRD